MSDDIKQFEAAVEEVEHSEAIKARIAVLVEEGMTPERAEDKAYEEEERKKAVVFTLRGRKMTAFQPREGQMAFLLANLGRGQTSDGRFAAIVNVMTNSLRGDDKDFFESLLLEGDRRRALKLETVEGIFSYLTEQWFRDDVSEGGAAL